MTRTTAALSPLALLALAALAPAQQQKVLPHGMDFVEGPLVYTYPFGRTTGAIQLLYDAPTVTLGQGVILGMKFRQSQVTASQTHPGYTKNYQVTAYTVATPAATMSADPAINVGTAVGTIVFSGPVTLPPVNPLTTQPAPFTIDIPFQQPYLYDGSQGNLLFVVETADTTAVATSYRIDAVNLAFNTATGLSSSIDAAGCANGSRSLALDVTQSAAIVGGSIQQNFTSNAPGSVPIVLACLSLGVQPQDLTPFGMPGCTLWLAPFEFRFVTEQPGGGFLPVSWPIPNAPWAEGIAFASQGLGLAPSGQLGQSVVSNAVGTRIGGQLGATRDMGMSFRSTASWSMGTNGVFMAVVELQGVFP
jgi:hypothetical protein